MAEALCTLHTFLPKVKKIELVNSIMVRLMDFLENCRYFYIKELSRRVIESNASIILNIPSRE